MLRRATRRLSRGWLAAVLGGSALLVLLIYASSFVISYGELFRKHDLLVRSDVARLAPARVLRVDQVRELEQLRAVLREARQRRLKVSISGSRHSQGGHTFTPGGIVLDMRGFNRIRDIDPVAMTITVESGATWDEVQRAIAPRGLALKVMQSSNIFTVGATSGGISSSSVSPGASIGPSHSGGSCRSESSWGPETLASCPATIRCGRRSRPWSC